MPYTPPSTASLDYGDDYLVFDGIESVSYYARTSESPVTYGAAVVLANALREEEHKTESGPGGALLVQITTAWHVATAQLGAVVPKVGDRITDSDGRTYVVKDGIEHSRRLTKMWRLSVQEA